MAESVESLLAHKRDLFDAIHALECDYRDGSMDGHAYRLARRRHELEAAAILARLDSLIEAPTVVPAGRRFRPAHLLLAIAGLVALSSLVLFLAQATHGRTASRAPAGAGLGAVAQPASASTRLSAAQREVRTHPGSADALVSLGTIYFERGDLARADRSFQAALRLRPLSADALTMEALVQSARGHIDRALQEVRSVERAHPRYARAWLIDGLFSISGHHRYAHAIVVWKRFVALEPGSAKSLQVKEWIRAAERARSRPPQ